MKRNQLFLQFIFVLPVVSSPVMAQSYSIEGYVRIADTVSPIRDASVTVRHAVTQVVAGTYQTTATGYYHIGPLSWATFPMIEVLVTSPDFVAALPHPINVQTGDTLRWYDAYLRPQTSDNAVRVVVSGKEAIAVTPEPSGVLVIRNNWDMYFAVGVERLRGPTVTALRGLDADPLAPRDLGLIDTGPITVSDLDAQVGDQYRITLISGVEPPSPFPAFEEGVRRAIAVRNFESILMTLTSITLGSFGEIGAFARDLTIYAGAQQAIESGDYASATDKLARWMMLHPTTVQFLLAQRGMIVAEEEAKRVSSYFKIALLVPRLLAIAAAPPQDIVILERQSISDAPLAIDFIISGGPANSVYLVPGFSTGILCDIDNVSQTGFSNVWLSVDVRDPEGHKVESTSLPLPDPETNTYGWFAFGGQGQVLSPGQTWSAYTNMAYTFNASSTGHTYRGGNYVFEYAVYRDGNPGAGGSHVIDKVRAVAMRTVDSTAPEGPLSVAVVRRGDGSEAGLSWDKSYYDVLGRVQFDLDQYEVHRATSAVGSYQQVATVDVDEMQIAPLLYTDSGLNPSTTYYYKVRAKDTNGNISSFSPIIVSSPPGNLTVNPLAGLDASGPVGGPFVPTSNMYTLTNVGAQQIEWQVLKSAAWLDVSPDEGFLAQGASVNVTISINNAASSLTSGYYSDQVAFQNTTNGAGNSVRDVTLAISQPGPSLSNGSVSPTSGSDQISYAFQVTFQDSRGLNPFLATVELQRTQGSPCGGPQWCLYYMSPSAGSVTTGRIYNYTTQLPQGTYSFRFHFIPQGGGDLYWPNANGAAGPNVSTPGALQVSCMSVPSGPNAYQVGDIPVLQATVRDPSGNLFDAQGVNVYISPGGTGNEIPMIRTSLGQFQSSANTNWRFGCDCYSFTLVAWHPQYTAGQCALNFTPCACTSYSPVVVSDLVASPQSACADGGPISISHTLTLNVSINPNAIENVLIRNSAGTIARTLVSGQQRTGGSWADLWDTRDDTSQPVAPGSYSAEVEAIHLEQNRPFEYFGQYGTTSCHIHEPWGIAVGPNGTVYVLDHFSTGTPCLKIVPLHPGSPMTCVPGEEYSLPFSFGGTGINCQPGHAMAVDNQNRLHILDDSGQRRVTVWNATTGQWITEYGSSQMQPTVNYPNLAPIYYHANNNRIYTWANDPSGGGCKVFIFDAASGALLNKFDPLPADGSNTPTATGIAVDAENNIWVVVQFVGTFVINPSGQVIRTLGGDSHWGSSRLLIRSGRIVYTMPGGSMKVWDLQGNLLQTICLSGDALTSTSVHLAGTAGQYMYSTWTFQCPNSQIGIWAGSRIRDFSSADFRSTPVTITPGAPSGTPANQTPPDASACQPTSVCLDWSDVSGATNYDAYWGTTYPPPFWQNVATSTACPPNQDGQTYYWFVVPRGACGVGSAGPTWSYTTGSAVAQAPVNSAPSNGATCQQTNTCLDWSDVSGATSYDVFWGTASPPPFWQNVAASNACPPNQPDLVYYWSVQARNACGLGPAGPTWTYATSASPCIIDCNHNGIADDLDITNGTSQDCNHDGIPDECELVGTLPVTSGLKLWLRAESVTGVPDGQPVAAWSDESGTGLHVSQSNANAQPVFIQNGPNGRPVLRFDGGDFFQRDSVIGSSLTSSNQATVLFVIKPSGSDSQNTLLGWGSLTNRFLFHTTYFGTLKFQHGNPDAGDDLTWPQPSNWPDALHVVQLYRNGFSAEARVDRVPLAPSQSFSNMPVLTESHPLFIGSDLFGNTMTGDVAELVVYNRALTASERDAVETYLCGKYAVLPQCPAPLNDCNGNGVPDECDLAVGSEPTWTQPSPATSPPARYGHAIADDSVRGVTVLFGGDNGSFLNDTWEWDGTTWTQRSPSTSPAPRTYHAMGYDAGRGRVVLFGGRSTNSVLLGDTWEWDGNSWMPRGETGPSPREKPAMAYDAGRARMVLFGGYDDVYPTHFRGDTWEWDGVSWVQRDEDETGPSPRQGPSIAYDANRSTTVLFGGWNGLLNGDTWEWDGVSWAPLATTGPSPRADHDMAYDAWRGRTVLFGGWTGAYLGDTWEWNGVSWAPLASNGPTPRREHAMTYDISRGKTVLFGGYNGNYLGDTWELVSINNDCNHNGILDECEPVVPLETFVAVLLGIEIDPTNRCLADMNHDGASDGRDVQSYLRRVSGP